MSEQARFALISIGPHGFTAHDCPNPQRPGCTSRLSGYDDARKHWHELEEGAPIVDCRPCESRDDWVRLVLRSPIPNVELGAGELEPFDKEAGRRSLQFASGWAGYLALGEIGGLDYIGPDGYAVWWARFGARVGKRKGQFIEWANGARELIQQPTQEQTT